MFVDSSSLLTSSTGANDPAGIWSGGFLDFAKTASDIASQWVNKPNGGSPASATPAPSTSSGTWQKYLPWILVGAGVLVLVMLFTRK